jgi:hypothetical protein
VGFISKGLKKAASAGARRGVAAAKAKGKKSTKHYCVVNDGRHRYVKWQNEQSQLTGNKHGPGISHYLYCNDCGFIDL